MTVRGRLSSDRLCRGLLIRPAKAAEPVDTFPPSYRAVHRTSPPSRGTCDATQHLVSNARATYADRTHRHGFSTENRHGKPLPAQVLVRLRPRDTSRPGDPPRGGLRRAAPVPCLSPRALARLRELPR